MIADASTTSAARVAANRANARRSTGPRTEQGKARSRANAVKHGLTGAGIALPTEDAALVERRFVGLQEDLAPGDLMGQLLVAQLALMSVRIERAARQEAAALAAQVRRATVDHDLRRQGEVARLFHGIEADPEGNRRLLLTYPEGVDRLDDALRSAREQLATGASCSWTAADRQRFEAFFGSNGAQFPVSRVDALLRALQGDFLSIPAAETAHLLAEDKAARRNWAREELIRLVDAERTCLATARAGFDLDALEQDRREAAARALFDPGPAAAAARRYEATAARNFQRAYRDFLQNEANIATAAVDSIPDVPDIVIAADPTPELPRAIAPTLAEPEPEPDRPTAPVAPAEPIPASPAARQNEPNPAPPAPATIAIQHTDPYRIGAEIPHWAPVGVGSGRQANIQNHHY